MSKITQKEAVYNAVINVCGKLEEGATYSPTREQRSQINAILFEGFKSETIELGKTFDDSTLKGYVSGVQSNWLRKDKRLNGGTAYIAKNPGSRQGVTDPQLKAMRALLSTLTDETERAEVQNFIDARIKEIGVTKVKKEVDFSVLPTELVTKFKK